MLVLYCDYFAFSQFSISRYKQKYYSFKVFLFNELEQFFLIVNQASLTSRY